MVFSHIVKTLKDIVLSAISQEQKNKHDTLVGYVGTENLISETDKGGHWRLEGWGKSKGKGNGWAPKPLWVRELSLVFSSSAG